jgi:hypothetical protein
VREIPTLAGTSMEIESIISFRRKMVRIKNIRENSLLEMHPLNVISEIGKKRSMSKGFIRY